MIKTPFNPKNSRSLLRRAKNSEPSSILQKKRRADREGKTIGECIVPWLFLAPSLLAVSILVLLPFLDALRRSFFSAISSEFVGFKNYQAVLNNEAFKLAASNTGKFIAVCIPLLLIISLIVALMLSALQEKHGIFKTSFLIPMAIPVASIALLWKVMFHKNGILNSILSLAGVSPVDWIGSDLSFVVLVFTYIWKNFGYDMVLWLSGISGINPAFYESAQLDGAGSFRRFTKITLPNLVPTLFYSHGTFTLEFIQSVQRGVSYRGQLSE